MRYLHRRAIDFHFLPFPSVTNMRVSKSVHFPYDPLTMISRQPTPLETRLLEDFEFHARRCRKCHAARHLTAFISPDLCAEGLPLAQDHAHLFYSASDGNVYSTTARTTRFFRVEVPINFIEVRRLYRIHYQPGSTGATPRGKRSCNDSRGKTNTFVLPIRTRGRPIN